MSSAKTNNGLHNVIKMQKSVFNFPLDFSGKIFPLRNCLKNSHLPFFRHALPLFGSSLSASRKYVYLEAIFFISKFLLFVLCFQFSLRGVSGVSSTHTQIHTHWDRVAAWGVSSCLLYRHKPRQMSPETMDHKINLCFRRYISKHFFPNGSSKNHLKASELLVLERP